MKIAMHQPQYLPWLGYFEKLDAADIFVILDDVQFEKNGWQNRNHVRFKGHENGWVWITVPVFHGHHLHQKILETKINYDQDWVKKHLKTIEQTYHRAPFFEPFFEPLKKILSVHFESLALLNLELLRWLLDALNLQKEIVLSSSLPLIHEHATKRLVQISKHLKADCFLAGLGGLAYLEKDYFDDAKIGLLLQNYQHPQYNQHEHDFISHLSVLDLLFHEGPKSLEILRSGRSWISYPQDQKIKNEEVA